MKKTLLLLTAIVFAVTSCSDSTYVDGEYTVEYDELDSHGWQAFVKFTLAEDVVSNVDYDYYDADGNLKSEDDGYQESMVSFSYVLVDGDTVRVGPQDYCPEIESRIEATEIVPEYVEIDVVAGATGSSEAANDLMSKGLDAAVDGTTEVSVPQPDPATEE